MSTQGHGPDLVLLHGWAMHSGVFDELIPDLIKDFRVHCIDLPGHGQSDYNGEMDSLLHVCEAVQPYTPPQAVVLGWSLGGQVALQLAQLMQLRALVLVSTTPKFVSDATWSYGMRPEVFAQFFARLQQNLNATVQDFLSLQVRGDVHAAETLASLKAGLLRYPPQPEALHAGLGILRDVDLRANLPAIEVPALVVAGEYDRIAHPDAAQFLATQLPQAHYQLCKRAGHAPFISHRDSFLQQLRSFLTSLAPL
ncbi:MAG: pimeloyl-ACP methyl ester esterase BioH [Steroidobacteraceae bacterium]